MTEYFIEDLKNYYDTVKLIENEGLSNVSLLIQNDISHCHTIFFLKNREISVIGLNKPEYNIYLDAREISLDPKWKFNVTIFSYSNNDSVNFSNLHFTYFIDQYDFFDISYEYDKKTDKHIEIFDIKEEFNFNSFSIVFMEFSNAKIEFKDCIFENNTNRDFEIIAKKTSNITFKNCVFNGDFIFNCDSVSKVIVQ